jgi:pimeloyl-ACP methyl ester carboxylesterase
VWPADWLAADAPGVRLLSLSFRSRYSDWEGSTAGLEALADAMLEKLTSAGVGQRPLVLVGHSMGGVLIKLMLARATQEPRHAQLAGALRGAVFYSCPHFGSALAALGSWAPKRLLRISPGVADLRPGQPALDSLNQLLRRLHKRPHASVRVLSFLEGAPTKLAELPVPGLKARAIAAEIVAMESAYPGFGELVVLPDSDHIDACKPRSRLDASYARTLALVREVLAEAQAEAQAAQAGKG